MTQIKKKMNVYEWKKDIRGTHTNMNLRGIISKEYIKKYNNLIYAARIQCGIRGLVFLMENSVAYNRRKVVNPKHPSLRFISHCIIKVYLYLV